MSQPFYVSAPGKVIIFGEHSAVYSKPAIAAALSLRAYLLVTPSEDPSQITLSFPDVSLSHSWNKDDIPWDEIKAYVQTKDGKPVATEELVPEITNELSGVLSDLDSSLHYVASHCFLYLYTHLCSKDIPGMTFSIRSTLPIGAGLGSSASVSVCLASALAVLGGHVDHATLHQNDKVVKNHNPEADFIDAWSLIGEKCYHGNPSGIDNAVATFGGAVMYQRMKNPSVPSVRTNMRNLPPIKLLLTNTKIPRSTAYLVGEVGKTNEKYPKTSASILEAMEHLATDAYQIMTRPFFGAEEKQKLRELVNINHGLLVALGVSHPALENIKIITETNKIGATKLTGAGGGGCAITLVNDDVSEETIQKTIDEFQTHGYETYETTLGGKGVASLQFDMVKEADKEKIFSVEAFTSYKDRFEVDGALSVDNLEGWRFW